MGRQSLCDRTWMMIAPQCCNVLRDFFELLMQLRGMGPEGKEGRDAKLPPALAIIASVEHRPL